MKDRARQIQNYLRKNQNEMIDFLKTLVAYETPSKDPSAQSGILKFLAQRFEQLSYRVTVVPGKTTGGFLIAIPKDRVKFNRVQLLIGHCDTVWAVNTLRDMPIVDEQKKISGPGIFDMKAGLTQIVYAIKAIMDLDFSAEVTPIVLINSDEEIGSLESTSAIKRLSKISDRAFVLEPPLGLNGKLKTTRKGIGRFTVTVKGKPAHAGLNPDQGVSAIVELSYQIQRLFELNNFEKGITVNVGMIQGGSSANVIAEESRAIVDVRVSNMEDAEMISKKIKSLKPIQENSEVIIDGYFGRPPMESTPRNRKLWEKARRIGNLLELELEEAGAGGGSDGNTTSLYTATLDGLGTIGEGAHARHEYILKDKLQERTALLTMLLLAKPVQNQGRHLANIN